MTKNQNNADQKVNSNNASRGFCFYVNYYNCPPRYRDLTDCDYLGSELIGCEGNNDSYVYDDGGSGSNNVEIVLDSILVTSPKTYTVGGLNYIYEVRATFLLEGYKFPHWPTKNYFTNLPSGNSYLLTLNTYYPATYTQIYAISNWINATSKQLLEVSASGIINSKDFGSIPVARPKGYIATDL